MPTKIELVNNYESLIKEAINNIEAGYFTVANRYKSFPIVSERVFCYEFYYQLRKLVEKSELTLEKHKVFFHGELSKATYSDYGRTTTDFLIHNPKNSDLNLITIEVKSKLGEFQKKNKDDIYVPDGVYKDFLSICNMLRKEYQLGVFILFGNSYDELLTRWRNKQHQIKPNDKEHFKSISNQIKIFIKVSPQTSLQVKLFKEFLDEVNLPIN